MIVIFNIYLIKMRRFSTNINGINGYKKWRTEYPNSWFSCLPRKNGFMPVGQPMKQLPSKYNKVNELLDNMRMYKKDGTNGDLYYGTFGDKVLNTVYQVIQN